MEDNSSKTILIEIPAYRDKQLIPTVDSALKQADNPDRVHFAICYQDDDLTDYNTLLKYENLSMIRVPLKDCRGACYARYLCQTLLNDEDYILHIDSHMRFIKHWDTALINQLEALNDDKAIISVYPCPLAEEAIKLPVTHFTFDKPTQGQVQRCRGFTENKKYLSFTNRNIDKRDVFPKRNVWLAGGYLFSRRNFDIEIPFDPQMMHLQDEHSVSLRAFTHGFNVYNTEELYILHWYHRPTRTMPTVPNNVEEWHRLLKLYRIEDNEHDLTGYDIGNVRTIEEFEKRSGVYFSDGKILKHAQAGFYFEDEIVKELQELSTSMNDCCNDMHEVNSKTINVFIVANNISDCIKCIKSAKEQAARPDLLKFIVISRKTSEELEENAEVIIVETQAQYGGYLAAINFRAYDADDFALVIDSGVRFTTNYDRTYWDEYYKRKLLEFGYNAVLGSCVYQLDETVATNAKVKQNKKHYILKRNGTAIVYDKKEDDVYDEPTHLLRDDFMFCKIDALQQVAPDPQLMFEEHTLSYSARLFTYGYDIYYPTYSYVFRTSDTSFLDKLGSARRHYDIVGFSLNSLILNTLFMKNDYRYGVGNKRRVASWLNLQNYDYVKNINPRRRK